MKILALETSCDETAAAVVRDGTTILASVISTQIPMHRPYDGVVPELASRSHLLTINRVVNAALKKAGIKKNMAGIDAIGVTVGPGLVGALLVGRMTAEAFGWANRIPVIGINHIEGHLLSPLLADPSIKPPFLGLVVSGGHTELIHVPRWGHYFLIGRTRDDAAGEAFDKVAKMMGLGYPGGPEVDRLARQGDAKHARFPRPWLPGTWDFSFSGLKTAALYKIREKKKWSLREKKDLCAGFQEAVVDVLSAKTVAAAEALRAPTVIVGGGVAANSRLRAVLSERAGSAGKKIFIAPPHLCTDNAAMIGAAAYFKVRYGKAPTKGDLKIEPQLHLPFYLKKTKSSW